MGHDWDHGDSGRQTVDAAVHGRATLTVRDWGSTHANSTSCDWNRGPTTAKVHG